MKRWIFLDDDRGLIWQSRSRPILTCLWLGLIPWLLHGAAMQEFASLHVPMDLYGKIVIPETVRHIRLDIGLSYSAPMSQQWISHDPNLVVFGFEPHPVSVATLRQGAVKQDPTHGEPLDPKYLNNRMFLLPCALGLTSGATIPFFITKNSCGCSSLYRPICFEIEQVLEVPIFTLSNFFELLPLDTHPIIDYIKIDAQGSDLDILKSAGSYLTKHVVYVTAEAENTQYANTVNSVEDLDRYMKNIGFERDYSQDTSDPTYFNPRFTEYIKKTILKIYQRG